MSITRHEAARMDGAEVVAALGSHASTGLTADQATSRLADVGPNELEEEPRRPVWRLVLAQFANTMIVVLMAAAAVTIVIGEHRDAMVITAILVLNAGIGAVQEHRAERAMAALTSMTAPAARVVRDGAESVVAAAELVPGDVVLLEAGDLVPADARLLKCPGLRVDEAALTGESLPVDKAVAALPHDAEDRVAEQSDLIFKGTAIVAGRARAIVAGTGMTTALGEVAGLLRTHQSPATPLQRRLAVLGRWLAVAALTICSFVFALGVLRGEDTMVMLLAAVALAVAAIPEALPAVVTISLALGAQRMARRHVLMRRLPAVETLGSVTVICSDKTGTLTQGRMQVERVWVADEDLEVTGSGYTPEGELLRGDRPVAAAAHPALARLVRAGALCNDAALLPPGEQDDWEVAGDPTEGALLVLAAKAGSGEVGDSWPRVGELAFDATRKRMSTLHRAEQDGQSLIATKGGTEAVLEVTTAVALAHGDVAVTPEIRDRVLHRAEAYAAEGYRVLAVAGRTADARDIADPSGMERELTLFGLIAMADPPRPESAAAVAACRRAGITPVMITGDHPATAAAIATRLGIDDGGQVLTGAQLAAEGADGLASHVEQVSVYARTTPEQKLDIVQAWQARGQIVAMTGDGVNDAPALRIADIGVAMGETGTEVAKEAAAMVLTDDDFATIVTAVGEGRRIYDNIQRFVRYTLTSNSGEIWVMLVGPFLGLPLPLLAVQILWINLVTDGLPGLALGVEGAERDIMHRPPRPPDQSVFARGMWQHILLVGLLMGAIPLTLGVWGAATGRPWQTMVFTSLALLQLGHAMAVRSDVDSLRRLGLLTNRPLLLTVVGTTALQLAVVYSSWGQALFHTQALAGFELAVVLLASTGVLLAVELEKAVKRHLGADHEPDCDTDAPRGPMTPLSGPPP